MCVERLCEFWEFFSVCVCMHVCVSPLCVERFILNFFIGVNDDDAGVNFCVLLVCVHELWVCV